MKTVAQHTCLNLGTHKDILKNSPFEAIHDPKKEKHQFLGTGYYFWDDNIEMARIWGEDHCKGSYVIIETELDINENICFDLVGNRKHLRFLRNFIERLKHYGIDIEEWGISQVLEFLKDKKINPDFDFQSIRAIDYTLPTDYNLEKYPFVTNTDHYTILNPKIIICVINKNLLSLPYKKIIEHKLK